jgi:signal transduction histidine kinase
VRISEFIRSNVELILTEWDRFARSNSPIELTDLVLRDHARQMLLTIAADVETPQSTEQQTRKSQGLGEETDVRSAASIHGYQRHKNEFSLVQLGAEFRALRSTVLRLWLPHVRIMSESTVLEVIRFNESIDQAIAESMVSYVEATSEAQNMFLAVLGHDLRSPLASMSMAGELLARDNLSPLQHSKLAHTVQRSAKLMKSMVDDLLGYTRVQFGKGLPVDKAWCDMSGVLQAAMDDAKATHPQTQYELRMTGDLAACYDGTRLHQLFVNLLVNAAQHGAKSRPVTIEASTTNDRATVRITNDGNVIQEAALKSIFKPLVQLAPDEPSDTRPGTSLGLGLFIAREIAEGHGGSVSVTSDQEKGTTFTVELPRDFTCRQSQSTKNLEDENRVALES